jgi:hypothetical protein
MSTSPSAEPEIREGVYRNETTGIEFNVTHIGHDRSGDLWWAERDGSGFLVTATALAECNYLRVEEREEFAMGGVRP